MSNGYGGRRLLERWVEGLGKESDAFAGLPHKVRRRRVVVVVVVVVLVVVVLVLVLKGMVGEEFP